jgi:hypothetical protein
MPRWTKNIKLDLEEMYCDESIGVIWLAIVAEFCENVG